MSFSTPRDDESFAAWRDGDARVVPGRARLHDPVADHHGLVRRAAEEAQGAEPAGKIGVILPDTESSVRWESADRPALSAAFEEVVERPGHVSGVGLPLEPVKSTAVQLAPALSDDSRPRGVPPRFFCASSDGASLRITCCFISRKPRVHRWLRSSPRSAETHDQRHPARS